MQILVTKRNERTWSCTIVHSLGSAHKTCSESNKAVLDIKIYAEEGEKNLVLIY